MGLLSEIFDIDSETEKEIKDILKAVSIVATVCICGGISDEIKNTLSLP